MTSVTDLLFDAMRSRVTGVRVRSRRIDGPIDDVKDDLIVDTSGRGSQLPEWLTASGRPQVREIVIDRAGFAFRVQRELVAVVRPAWNLATGEDLRLDTTTGGRLRARDRWLQWYVDRVIAASTSDTAVRHQLLSVMNMISGPEALLHPRTAARVVSHLCGRRRPMAPLWSPVTGSSRESAIDRLAIRRMPDDQLTAARGSWAVR